MIDAMLSVVASFACCWIAAGGSPLAQERRPLLGTVVDAGGKPLASGRLVTVR